MDRIDTCPECGEEKVEFRLTAEYDEQGVGTVEGAELVKQEVQMYVHDTYIESIECSNCGLDRTDELLSRTLV